MKSIVPSSDEAVTLSQPALPGSLAPSIHSSLAFIRSIARGSERARDADMKTNSAQEPVHEGAEIVMEDWSGFEADEKRCWRKERTTRTLTTEISRADFICKKWGRAEFMVKKKRRNSFQLQFWSLVFAYDKKVVRGFKRMVLH